MMGVNTAMPPGGGVRIGRSRHIFGSTAAVVHGAEHDGRQEICAICLKFIDTLTGADVTTDGE